MQKVRLVRGHKKTIKRTNLDKANPFGSREAPVYRIEGSPHPLKYSLNRTLFEAFKPTGTASSNVAVIPLAVPVAVYNAVRRELARIYNAEGVEHPIPSEFSVVAGLSSEGQGQLEYVVMFDAAGCPPLYAAEKLKQVLEGQFGKVNIAERQG